MKGISSVLVPVASGIGVVLAVAVAGCGGGESHLARAQFLSQANAICRRAATEQERLASGYPKGAVAYGHYGASTAVFVPPMEKELRRLKALSPPPEDERKVRVLLEEIEGGVEDAKADYLDLFVKVTDPFRSANERARRYGLKACATSSHAVIKPQG